MGVGLLGTEVLQLPSQQLLEDIKALGVHLELGHLLNDLLKENGLLVVVATQHDLRGRGGVIETDDLMHNVDDIEYCTSSKNLA